MREKKSIFRGAFLGLAVGDAMGYTVDRKSLAEIREDYGPNGLLGYDLVNGYAEASSYTQLAAFTANGLLFGLTRGKLQGRMAPPVRYIALALREWSRSQQYCDPERNYCWLSSVPELKRRRCMDTRMLDALNRETLGTPEAPVYRNDYPSALTEALALALLQEQLGCDREAIVRLGAEAVALTHGDAEAFLSGAVLTHALSLLLENPKLPAEELVQNTIEAIQIQFGREFGQTTHIWELLHFAQTLAANESITQVDAMEQLSCRTAPEVLAGVLYACLTCHGDFDAAMITAVNHSGRSCAVGAITGAILGLIYSEDALPEFYMESLEPLELLRQIADDVAQGCPMDKDSLLFDDDWDRKYLHAGK